MEFSKGFYPSCCTISLRSYGISILTQLYSHVDYVTNQTTKTSPFYLLYGRQPHLVGDPNRALPVDTPPADSEERIRLLQSARQEAAVASYERARLAKRTRDDLVKPHTLDDGDWVLIRQEGHNKFETNWFGPYAIAIQNSEG